MKPHFFDTFYTIDPETGHYVIDIDLNYKSIYHWDSFMYVIRDLDSNLILFLEKYGNDIALTKRVILRLNLHSPKKDLYLERKIEKGIRRYFEYCKFTTKKTVLPNPEKNCSLYFRVFRFYSCIDLVPELRPK